MQEKNIDPIIVTLIEEVTKILNHNLIAASNRKKIVAHYTNAEQKLFQIIELDPLVLEAHSLLASMNTIMVNKIMYKDSLYIGEDKNIVMEAKPYLEKIIDACMKAETLLNIYDSKHPYYTPGDFIYNLHGNALVRLSRSEEALLCFNKALEFNPDHLDSLNRIALILIDTKKLDDAEQYLYRILKKHVKDHMALSNLGWIAEERKEFKKAKTYYEEIINTDSGAYAESRLKEIAKNYQSPLKYNLEVIKEKAFTNQYSLELLHEYIDDDGLYVEKVEPISFYTYNMGNINIVDGKIIVSDPIYLDTTQVFKEKFPKGSFPIELALVQFNKNSEDAFEKVGLARIKFSEQKPIKWEIAYFEEQANDQDKIEKDICTYGVDTTLGCFMDMSVVSIYEKAAEKLNFHEKLMDTIYASDEKGWSHYIWKKGKTIFPIFSTGDGDGVYRSYIGYDENNQICRLLTDFEIVRND